MTHLHGFWPKFAAGAAPLRDGAYQIAGGSPTTADILDRYTGVVTRFAIRSIEVGLVEDDG